MDRPGSKSRRRWEVYLHVMENWRRRVPHSRHYFGGHIGFNATNYRGVDSDFARSQQGIRRALYLAILHDLRVPSCFEGTEDFFQVARIGEGSGCCCIATSKPRAIVKPKAMALGASIGLASQRPQRALGRDHVEPEEGRPRTPSRSSLGATLTELLCEILAELEKIRPMISGRSRRTMRCRGRHSPSGRPEVYEAHAPP